MTHDDNITASGDVVPAANNHNRPSRSIETRKNRLSKGNKGVSIKDHGSRNHRTNSSSNGIKQDPDDGDNSSSGSEFDGGGDGTSMDTNSHDSFSSSLLRKVRKVNGLSKADQEIVRLVGQHLTNIGLKSSAAVLMAEAGCRLDQPTAATFRKFVMNGDWSSAVNTLEELKAHLENPDNFVEMKFLLLEQKYLELLYRGNSIEALKVLQTEITPLKHNQPRTHELSSYLMFSSPEDLVRVTSHQTSNNASNKHLNNHSPSTRSNGFTNSTSTNGVDGCSSTSRSITDLSTRRALMDSLQAYLPATIMLPPKRLLTLLNQAAEFQTERCLYHNKSISSNSIFDTAASSYNDIAMSSTGSNFTSSCLLDASYLAVDHQCSKQDFPCDTIQVLSDHCEEVWFCKSSPDGRKLATGSKDNTVIIWDFDPETLTLKINKSLEPRSQGVSFFAWSPDSTRLAVCGPEDCDEIHLWNVDTGLLEGKISHSTEDSLTTVSWSPDGRKITCGGSRGQFYQCDAKGQVLDSWEGVRVQCLSYRKDGKSVLAADTHHRLRSYNFEELSDYSVLQEDHGIMTFTLDDNDRYALLNVATQGLHMWDVEERCLVRKFVGITQGFYTVYSCFGGADQNFIASGSEDNKVYIFHVKKESPIAVLSGHSRTVNCVTWNPVYPRVLVSASDDGTVRVWGPAEKYRKPPTVPEGQDRAMNGSLDGSQQNGANGDSSSNEQQPNNHCSNGVV